MLKYDVIDVEEFNNPNKIGPSYKTFTICDNKDNNTYKCAVEFSKNDSIYQSIIWVDSELDFFELANALFLYDMDLYKVIPSKYISPEMDDIYESYFVGHGNRSLYRTMDEYNKAKDDNKNIVYKKER